MTTLSDVANADTPAIAAIRRDHGPVVAKAFLVIALVDLIDFFNVTNTFTDQQINATADLIMQEFYWLKPEDFKLCFNNAKLGRYGQTYNRLDGAVIFEWLNTYQSERAEFFAIQRAKENFSPAIRSNETKQMHELYDKVVKEQEGATALLQRKRELRAQAVKQWNDEYNQHFEGVEITPEAHQKYIQTYPLSESYIQFFIRKNLDNG